jgi:hypothetical protein
MRTYEKPPASGSRGSKYTGLIAVICLVASMLAAWALVRTSRSVISPSTLTTGKTTGIASSVPVNQ